MGRNQRAVECRASRACGLIATVLLAWGLAAAGPAAAVTRDERAVALAERTLEAMGGRAAWEATRYLRFTFAGLRTHTWDRATGRHRLEGTDREGRAYIVVSRLGTGEGRAWLDGAEVTEPEARSALLELANAAWVNDTYWLLMPYKLLDPGVSLAYAGRQVVDGATYEVVELSFEGVGLTPGDRYWAYFDPETGLLARWAYHLESYPPEKAPTAWLWNGWQRYGAILLAPERAEVGGDRKLILGGIEVPDTIEDSVFEGP